MIWVSLQDMTTQDTFTASLSGITYEGYESMLGFTASITGSIVGEEYRATLFNSGSSEAIWHGNVQVYASQSIDKSVYENQNKQYKSNVSENKYIIMK
jgi:hypothetical protein